MVVSEEDMTFVERWSHQPLLLSLGTIPMTHSSIRKVRSLTNAACPSCTPEHDLPVPIQIASSTKTSLLGVFRDLKQFRRKLYRAPVFSQRAMPVLSVSDIRCRPIIFIERPLSIFSPANGKERIIQVRQ